MNYRRASTIELILLSAAAYAAIPVVLSELDPLLVTSFPLVMILLKLMIALPVLLWRIGRHKVLSSIRDRSVLLFSSLQAFFFVLSLVLFSLSLTNLGTPVAIVIAETWPIPSAIAMSFLLRDQLSRLTISEFIWGAIAFVGVMLVLDMPNTLGQMTTGTWVGTLWALASAIAMGLSTAFKARAVKLLKDRHKVGPIFSYFLLQFFFLPALPIFALFFIGFTGSDPSITVASSTLVSALPLVALIVALNFTSSVLYSFATLKLERASDGFVWFFTPAFSLLLFTLWTDEPLAGHELIGLTFILSSNLLLTIAADTTRAFKALVLSVLGAGSWCYFVDPIFTENEHYFDAISILSIFFVVILAEGLGQIQRQTDSEDQLLIRLNHDLAEAPVGMERQFECLLEARDPISFKRRYHILRRELIANDMRHVALQLDQLAYSRNRTLRLGKHVSLAACLFASAAIGLAARPQTWLAEVFITVYLPSMVFSFFVLIEGQLDTEQPLFRRLSKSNHTYVVRIMSLKSPRDSIIWSLILSGSIISTYAYALSLP